MIKREEAVDIVAYKRQGLSNREIARKLGIHRKTVSKYLANGGEVKPYDTRNRACGVDRFRESIKHWIEEEGYNGVRMHRLLGELGYTGGVRTVQRYAKGIRGGLIRKAYRPFETEAGRQAQVDFGEFTVVDAFGNKEETLYLFLMVLGYSRKRYAELVVRPDLTSFLDCHRRAFEYFGGVPCEGLYDCMKNVVTRVNGSEPKWNDMFYGFARHYGFAPRLCPPYASWVKGKVERPIRFIREDFWRGYQYRGLAEANQDLMVWLKHKELSIHGTTQQTISERFELERGYLGGLPALAFDTSERYFRTVHKDCCIHLGYNRYMLPHTTVGKKVIMRVKDDTLRVFDGAELVVTYQIPQGRGHLIADERVIKALKADPVQNRMKYRTPPTSRKGTAKTIGIVAPGYDIAVYKRDISVYDAAIGGLHE
ncbi:MAG: IS21 family transposase [Deltaproteobacteria bacterium]|nr:IS21 family transposase [Deltaproteobacteria bacterium]